MAPATAYPPSLALSAIRRPIPEVGAVCGKAALTDLCGGCEVTRIPTATKRHPGARALRPPACRCAHAGYEIAEYGETPMRANDGTRTAGEVLIDQLIVHGVRHAFCVPGESYI